MVLNLLIVASPIDSVLLRSCVLTCMYSGCISTICLVVRVERRSQRGGNGKKKVRKLSSKLRNFIFSLGNQIPNFNSSLIDKMGILRKSIEKTHAISDAMETMHQWNLVGMTCFFFFFLIITAHLIN